MKSIDPARMSPAERLAELGEILAVGVQRFLPNKIKPAIASVSASNSQDQLDVAAAVEAPCGSAMESPT